MIEAGRFARGDEVFVTLEVAAQCYSVETHWVREVYATGLLGTGERFGGAIAIAEIELDRLAAVVRWHRYCGLDLEVVAALYGRPLRELPPGAAAGRDDT